MLYTKTNIAVSLQTALATHLRATGFDVWWHRAAIMENQTAGLQESLAIITIVDPIPANSIDIIRLNAGEAHTDLSVSQVALPALSLLLVDWPSLPQRLGIGHTPGGNLSAPSFEWNREFRVDALANNEHEQDEIATALWEWAGVGDVRFQIYDYDSDPVTPSALNPARVQWVDQITPQVVDETDELRYYIRLDVGFSYEE